MAKTIAIDPERCLACNSCHIACAIVHSDSKVLEEAIHQSPAPQRRLTVEAAGQSAVPMQCRHCEDAPCIEVCPTDAIARQNDAEPVIIDEQLCIGCKCCLLVCPFGVIEPSRDGRVMVKCDMCIERTEIGQEPACAQACPTGALKFVELTEYIGQKRKTAAMMLTRQNKNSTKKEIS